MSCPVRISALTVFVLMASLLGGCSRHPEAAQATAAENGHPLVNDTQPVQGDWVIQRIDSDLDSLNPLTLETANGQVISGEVNEGMLQMNNFSLKLEPCLAESWEISPDQLTYIFHLRHGVKWHDGQPFTADDVKFTFDRVMDPKVDAAQYRVYFANIKSWDVLDPYTIRFNATEKYFKTLEQLGSMPIIPRHAFDKGDPDFNKNDFARHPIGTGPYKFVRWDTGSQIALERNDDYWDVGHPRYPKRLVYEVIEEPYVAAQLLKKGEIDVFDKVTPIQWEHELKDSRSMSHLHEIVYPFPAYYYIGFNLRQPMFSDVRVRHALDLLMPRDEIISQVYLNKYATKTSGYNTPASRNYNHDVPPTAYDPAQALQLLDEAGWKNDHGDGLLYKNNQPFRFTLFYPSGDPNRGKMAELVQESFKRVGIDLKLERLAFAQLIARVDDWKFDASLQGWALDLNDDPSQIWSSSQADEKKSSNFIGYKSAEADKLIEAGKLEYDDEKRAVIYRQLHKLIHDDYPVSFLVCPNQIMIISDRFQNVKIFAPRPCFDITMWWVPKALQKYGN